MCVWQISFDVQLHIQSVTWCFQKKWMNVNGHLHFFLLKGHLHVTCLVVRVISIFKVSIDVLLFSLPVTLHVKIKIVCVIWRAIHFYASFCVSNVKNLQNFVKNIHWSLQAQVHQLLQLFHAVQILETRTILLSLRLVIAGNFCEWYLGSWTHGFKKNSAYSKVFVKWYIYFFCKHMFVIITSPTPMVELCLCI